MFKVIDLNTLSSLLIAVNHASAFKSHHFDMDNMCIFPGAYWWIIGRIIISMM